MVKSLVVMVLLHTYIKSGNPGHVRLETNHPCITGDG